MNKNAGGCFDALARPLLGLLRADQLAANFRRIALSPGNLGIGGVAMGASGVDADAGDRDAFVVDITGGSNDDGPGKHGVLIVSEKPHGVRRVFVDVGPVTGVVYLYPDGTWHDREPEEATA